MKLVTNSLVHVKSIHQLAIYTMTNATVCHLQHLKKKEEDHSMGHCVSCLTLKCPQIINMWTLGRYLI